MKQHFNFDNTYAKELEGFYAPWKGAVVPEPKLLKLNVALAHTLGLDIDYLQSPEGLAILAGSVAPEGADTLAMAYAGHQFGGFSPQLGDGRALLLGEIIDQNGLRQDIHLKGSGRTPFSRGGDGKAVLGPVLREYLIGEAMHALGIPTTRALSAVATGEQIMRQGYEPGAVLSRIASSHLRIGTFQFFAARKDSERLKILADYAINRHYPELKGNENRYLNLLTKVIDKQVALVAKWVAVGFVHGVMNTDNTTISGETIDYGPCAFIDYYDPNIVFSSIDHQGRYAYGNQPLILQWNIARFAETVLGLIDPKDEENAIALATKELEQMSAKYASCRLTEMQAKFGLIELQAGDGQLIDDLFEILAKDKVDYTQFFRALAKVLTGEESEVKSLFSDSKVLTALFMPWLVRWKERIVSSQHDVTLVVQGMNDVNPVYIPRNHKVDMVLKEATDGNLAPFEELLALLLKPYEEVKAKEDFASPPPDGTPACVTYCGT